MRTVTFANQDLIDSINESCVPLWNSQSPELVMPDPEKQKQPKPSAIEAAAYPQGAGGTNVLAFFCSPEGKIVHVSVGYWSAENFSQEVEFAKQQFQLGQSNEFAKEELVETIQQRIEDLKGEQAELASEHPDEMQKSFSDSEIRRHHAAIGLQVQSSVWARSRCVTDLKETLEELLINNLTDGICS